MPILKHVYKPYTDTANLAYILSMVKVNSCICDAYFHGGMPIFTVNIGIGMPIIICVKMGIRDAHIRGCLLSPVIKIYTPRKYGHPGVPIFT